MHTLNPEETRENLSGQIDKVSLCIALETLNFTPDIDLFASHINHQFPKYVSLRPDPEAFAIDAFSLDWSNLNFLPSLLSVLFQQC